VKADGVRRAVDAGVGPGIDPVWLDVLANYGLGQPGHAEAAGGTASPKLLVRVGARSYLVRRRRPTSSADEVISFDHGVIGSMVDAGLPTVRPIAAADGRTWVRLGEHAYEAFPFVSGLVAHSQGNVRQLEAAARTLARLHRATDSLMPPGRKDWPREHCIQDMTGTLRQELAGAAERDARLPAARAMLASAERLAGVLSDPLVARLPRVIVHGDYTPANVLFRGDRVGGVFDLDWVSRQPRVLDVGEALQFFAFRRNSALDPDSIWSLVQAWEPDEAAAAAFLRAYQSTWPLDDDESGALPLFMLETWLGVHIRAMRKVVPEDRLSILTDGALEPLRWLEEQAGAIRRLVTATRGGMSGAS